MKVLIVDDAIFMRTVLRNMLQKHNINVVGEAGNGLEAIQKYKELKPDLVTMDITMPKMTGIEALIEIKKIDPKAKVIMCSAMGQQAMVIEAFKNGSKDFIVKPFKEDKVMESIMKVGTLK